MCRARVLLTAAAVALIAFGLAGRAESSGSQRTPWGKSKSGETVDLYTLTNAKGHSVAITTLGGIVVSVKVPDKSGALGDVVLGFDSLRELLPEAKEIKAAEKILEQESVLSQWLLPGVQFALTAGLHAGNEQVYLGRDGWLFYRADVDYVTGPPFLDAARMTPVPNARRDLFEAMRLIAETGHGPKEQLPSMGCSIKWSH